MARQFNGGNQYLQTTLDLGVTVTYPFTVSFRGRLDTASSSGIAWGQLPLTARTFALGWWGSTGRIYVHLPNTTLAWLAAGDIDWHQFDLIVTAGNAATLYFDGGPLGGTAGANLNPAGAGLRIGGRGSTIGWPGRIAEMSVLDRAITPAESEALTGRYSPQFVLPDATAYWPLGGLYGQHDRDTIGGFDGTPVNSPTWADHPPVIYPSSPLRMLSEAIEPGSWRSTQPHVHVAGGRQPHVHLPGSTQPYVHVAGGRQPHVSV